jgi:hypothetical protein
MWSRGTTALKVMTSTNLPEWLSAAWSRNYIRRAGPDGILGRSDASVAVRYVQTLASGHGFDLRVADNFSLPDGITGMDCLSLEQLQALAGAVEGFAGVTMSESIGENAYLFAWHAAFLFPPQLGDTDEPQAVLASIAAGDHETGDVGRAVPSLPAARKAPITTWRETAPDASYEEEWQMLDGFDLRGAHLAALRRARSGVQAGGACWLGILGNSFAFVRDIDRSALPSIARGRPLAEVLADESVPMAAKRAVLDCEFSFGTFGQGAGVGGVVQFSSLPWRRGIALAMLIGEASSGWEPVRSSDESALRQALGAVIADHKKACSALREAEASGQTAVAEILRARGALA